MYPNKAIANPVTSTPNGWYTRNSFPIISLVNVNAPTSADNINRALEVDKPLFCSMNIADQLLVNPSNPLWKNKIKPNNNRKGSFTIFHTFNMDRPLVWLDLGKRSTTK